LANLFIVKFESGHVLARFGKFSFFHAFTDVPEGKTQRVDCR
jgi:hypothetical protein